MNHDLKVVLKVDTMRNKCILAKSFPKRITCKLLQQQKLLVVIKEKGGGNVFCLVQTHHGHSNHGKNVIQLHDQHIFLYEYSGSALHSQES